MEPTIGVPSHMAFFIGFKKRGSEVQLEVSGLISWFPEATSDLHFRPGSDWWISWIHSKRRVSLNILQLGSPERIFQHSLHDLNPEVVEMLVMLGDSRIMLVDPNR